MQLQTQENTNCDMKIALNNRKKRVVLIAQPGKALNQVCQGKWPETNPKTFSKRRSS